MALEVSTSKRQSSLESIDLKFLRKLLQTHPQYNQHKWDTKSAADFLKKPKDPAIERKSERRRCLERLIGRLVVRDIPGKDLIEEYLQDQYRRNLSVKTREEEYFRAMEIIERGQLDGHYRMDNQFQEIFKTEELLSTHHQKLYEHAETLYPMDPSSGGDGESQRN